MKASILAQAGLLAMVSILTGCECEECGDCQAVQYSAKGEVDTVAIAKTAGDCTVNAYAADSVGPKPKR